MYIGGAVFDSTVNEFGFGVQHADGFAKKRIP
jgi:hypothetical protein